MLLGRGRRAQALGRRHFAAERQPRTYPRRTEKFRVQSARSDIPFDHVAGCSIIY